MTYTGAGLLAIMIHFIINYRVFRNTHFRHDSPNGKSFRGLILSIMAFFVFDSFWGVLYDAHLITLVFMSIAMIVLIIGAKKENSVKRHHNAIGMYAIIMAAMVILQVVYLLLPMYTIGCLLGSCVLHTFVVEDLKEERRLELEEMVRREKQKDRELGSATVKFFSAFRDFSLPSERYDIFPVPAFT